MKSDHDDTSSDNATAGLTTPKKAPQSSLYDFEPVQSCHKMILQTPDGGGRCLDCPICLSPIADNDPDNPGEMTKCRHLFHSDCLEQAKNQAKSECPLCRTLLTPPESVFRAQYTMQERDMRQNIVSAASRGRNAVRLALERRMANPN